MMVTSGGGLTAHHTQGMGTVICLCGMPVRAATLAATGTLLPSRGMLLVVEGDPDTHCHGLNSLLAA